MLGSVYRILLFVALIEGMLCLDGTYILEEKCGQTIRIPLKEKPNSFKILISEKKDADLSQTCQVLLEFMSEAKEQEELWATVKVDNITLEDDPNSEIYGGCNSIHGVQVLSHGWVRAIYSKTEFSVRVSNVLRLQYYRLVPPGNFSLDMTVNIEAANIEKFQTSNKYENISFENNCHNGREIDVGDEPLKFIHTIQRKKEHELLCMSPTLIKTLKDEEYFVNVEIEKLKFYQDRVPHYGCMVYHFLQMSGEGWMQAFSGTTRVLMKHKGPMVIEYKRDIRFHQTFNLDMRLRINTGDKIVEDGGPQGQDASVKETTIEPVEVEQALNEDNSESTTIS